MFAGHLTDAVQHAIRSGCSDVERRYLVNSVASQTTTLQDLRHGPKPITGEWGPSLSVREGRTWALYRLNVAFRDSVCSVVNCASGIPPSPNLDKSGMYSRRTIKFLSRCISVHALLVWLSLSHKYPAISPANKAANGHVDTSLRWLKQVHTC